MKRNVLISIFSFVFCLQSFAQFPVFQPQDTAVCGGERMKYYITPKSSASDFVCYSWSVTRGTFDNGETTYVNSDQDDPTAWVTWSESPSSIKGKVRVVVVKQQPLNNWEFEEEPYIFAVATPDQIYQAVNGEVKVPAGSVNFTFSIADDQSWYVTSYLWRFHPTGGSTRSYSSGTTKQKTISFTGTEYGTFDVRSKTTKGDCDIISDPLTVDLVRYLVQPGNFSTYDEVMCNNTTSTFAIPSVTEADTYLWEATGGFTIYNGSSYVTSYETSSTSVTVKSRSSNGGGTISVTAKPPSSDTHTLDSEPREMDVWSGAFGNTYVTGTAAVCHNSLYVYTAVPPVGSPSTYNYSWPTKPSGWYTMSTWTNNIQVATPILASNMTYGPIRAKIQNECGWSTEGGITTYPGYGCGGYYMAAPNPAGEYTEIDIASDDAKTLEANSNSKITLTVVDKMGVPVMKDVVYSLPYQLNTSKFPKGEYIIQIISESKDKETRIEGLKLLVN